MPVVITGASGFAGGALARALSDLGQSVLSIGRTDPLIQGVPHLSWDVLAEPSPPVVAAAGANPLVVHAAGLVGPAHDADAYHFTNVVGTRRVLDLFAGSRIVCLSTAGVYDPHADHDMSYEEAAPVPVSRYVTPYARSKAEAEAVVARVHKRSLVLRPAPLYGPGEKYNLPYLAAHIHKGRLELPGGGRNLISLCSVENLVAAVLAGLRRPEVTGPVNVADGEVYELAEAVNPLLARVGLDYVQVDSVPADLARFRSKGPVRRLWGRSERRWSPAALLALSHDRTFDTSRLTNLLGVSPDSL